MSLTDRKCVQVGKLTEADLDAALDNHFKLTPPRRAAQTEGDHVDNRLRFQRHSRSPAADGGAIFEAHTGRSLDIIRLVRGDIGNRVPGVVGGRPGMTLEGLETSADWAHAGRVAGAWCGFKRGAVRAWRWVTRADARSENETKGSK